MTSIIHNKKMSRPSDHFNRCGLAQTVKTTDSKHSCAHRSSLNKNCVSLHI